MTFRARLLITVAVAALIPLALLALGARRELTSRLTGQYSARVRDAMAVARGDLTAERERIRAALASVATSLANDDAFRATLARGGAGDRGYVLDFAERAMGVAGLSMLQVQNDEGRILSSGHFRHEFDRLEPALPSLLASAPPGALTLTHARAPKGPFLALALVDSARVAGRWLHVVGGVGIDDRLLARIARSDGMRVHVELGASPVDSVTERSLADTLPMLYARLDSAADGAAGPALVPARLVVRHSLAELTTMRRDLNRWTIVALSAAALGVVALAVWSSAALSRPLADLAAATSRIELGGDDAGIVATRNDEVGTVARRLVALTSRLRASAMQLRDAERRATVGDVARQVNHDIKNGLVPIRNVLRHLDDVAARDADALARIYAERRGTLASSVEYLDTLARNYARLTPPAVRGRTDVNAIARDVARGASTDTAAVHVHLDDGIAPLLVDQVVVRRVLENVVRNAIESLPAGGGRVSITTARDASGGVRLSVADTGRGMTDDERRRACDDFYTTKESGTGLGLSVVRRLVADLGGSVSIDSVHGTGTTVTIVVAPEPAQLSR